MNQAKIEKYIERVVNLSDAELLVQAGAVQRSAKISWWSGVIVAALSIVIFIASWTGGDNFHMAFQGSASLFLVGLMQIMVSLASSQRAVTLQIILRLRKSNPAGEISPSSQSIPQA